VKDFLWAKDAKGNWRPEWTPIGQGMVRFPQFFEMLAASHFAGPLQMHFEYPLGDKPEQVYAAMRRDLAAIRDIIKSTKTPWS
jgi:sugar phosphate isomerase/epimerase